MIIRCTKYDLLQLPIKEGQIYYVSDMKCLYRDTGVHKSARQRFPALVLNTENERLTRIRPENGRNYYVVQSNNLWVFDARWVLKEGSNAAYNAYGYDGNSGVTPIVSVDEQITSPITGDRIIDNNGLLGDGSVVIRDSSRIVKGVLKNDNSLNELSFTSYLDNGITLYPYGLEPNMTKRKELGSLHLGIQSKEAGTSWHPYMERRGVAEYNGDLYIYGNIYNVVPVKTGYTITHVPEYNQKMCHIIKTSKVQTTDRGVKYTEYYDFKINVLSETAAEVTLTQYNKEESYIGITGDNNEMLYDGVFVWGSETKYEATRTIGSSEEEVSYTLHGRDSTNVITIHGGIHSAPVEFNGTDFSEDTSNVVAVTELQNVYCLTSQFTNL